MVAKKRAAKKSAATKKPAAKKTTAKKTAPKKTAAKAAPEKVVEKAPVEEKKEAPKTDPVVKTEKPVAKENDALKKADEACAKAEAKKAEKKVEAPVEEKKAEAPAPTKLPHPAKPATLKPVKTAVVEPEKTEKKPAVLAESIECHRVRKACEAFIASKKIQASIASQQELTKMINKFVAIMQISKANSTKEALQYLFDFFIKHRKDILAPAVALQGIRSLKPVTAQSLEVFYTVLSVGVERKLGIQTTPISLKAARHLLQDHPILDFVAAIK